MFGKSLIIWAVSALAATQLASAHPHDRRGLQRRHPIPDVVTVRKAATTVYVDQYGNTVDPNSPRTVFVTVYKPGSAPTVSTSCRSKKAVKTSTPVVREPQVDNPNSSKAKAQPTKPVEEVPPTPSKVKYSTSSTPQETGTLPPRSYTPGTYPSGNKPGMVYSPYRADRTCKSRAEVAADVEKLKNFSPLRLYGVDCNQIQNVIAAGKPYGIQVFAGIWDVDKADAELETLIEAVGNDWDSVHTVAVGNEVVNFGRMDATRFASIINQSRKRLREPSVGYNGPVVGVDTFVAILSNPAICEASDFVAANCHPFFDGNIAAEGSGQFLENMKKEMAKKCGNKQVIITESGWPTRGSPNGKAVPGVVEQKAAIKSIVDTQNNDVILFTAFDDPWKQDTPHTFGTEQFWGIQDKSLR
ncbi:glycoside hydrolase superfamily [Trichophaea hybrida]|nr:glycoside hydrolase superfamily [Trichophaea hybrida]